MVFPIADRRIHQSSATMLGPKLPQDASSSYNRPKRQEVSMAKRSELLWLCMSEFSRHVAAAVLASLLVCWSIAADEGSPAPSAQGSSGESQDSAYTPLRGKVTT